MYIPYSQFAVDKWGDESFDKPAEWRKSLLADPDILKIRPYSTGTGSASQIFYKDGSNQIVHRNEGGGFLYGHSPDLVKQVSAGDELDKYTYADGTSYDALSPRVEAKSGNFFESGTWGPYAIGAGYAAMLGGGAYEGGMLSGLGGAGGSTAAADYAAVAAAADASAGTAGMAGVNAASGTGLMGGATTGGAAAAGTGGTANSAAATAAESAFAITPEAAASAGANVVPGTAAGTSIGSIAGTAGASTTGLTAFQKWALQQGLKLGASALAGGGGGGGAGGGVDGLMSRTPTYSPQQTSSYQPTGNSSPTYINAPQPVNKTSLAELLLKEGSRNKRNPMGLDSIHYA
jgi:hypothetical protein